MELVDFLKLLKDRQVGLIILTIDGDLHINLHCTKDGQIKTDQQCLPGMALDSMMNEAGKKATNELLTIMVNNVSPVQEEEPKEQTFKGMCRGNIMKEDTYISKIEMYGDDVTKNYIHDTDVAIPKGTEVYFPGASTQVIITYTGEIESFL